MPSGHELERQIFELLKEEIASGDLGLTPSAQVFQGKGYYSRDRGKEIKVDVSVELFRRGATEPYLLWIWECKDYGGSIPVDDIEEFHAKLEQLGADGTKGTMVARGNYQEGTINYARSKKIGLARLRPDGSLVLLLEAVRDVSKEVMMGFSMSSTDPRHTSLFYGMTSGGACTRSLGDLVAREMQTS